MRCSCPEVGLYNMRNRWYEPFSGRFLSEDPLGVEAGPNVYLLSGNDPVNGSDPRGLQNCPGGFVEPFIDVRGNEGVTVVCPPWSGNPYPRGPSNPGAGRQPSGDPSDISGPSGLPTSSPPKPPQGAQQVQKLCVGRARVLEGNTRLVGRQGGFPGVRVTMGSAAIDPFQFGGSKSHLAPHLSNIKGYTRGGLLFSGITDVIGNTNIPPGYQNIREYLRARWPNTLLLEIVGSPDLMVVDVSLSIPSSLSCPSGTAQR